MSFGKPVFLSNLTSLPEIGGDEAYYFSSFEPSHMVEVFENGMNDYNKDTLKKERLASRAKLFSWERAAKEYIELYKSL
jgi:glycosyltransferase involved in cell wall biosynthesis